MDPRRFFLLPSTNLEWTTRMSSNPEKSRATTRSDEFGMHVDRQSRKRDCTKCLWDLKESWRPLVSLRSMWISSQICGPRGHECAQQSTTQIEPCQRFPNRLANPTGIVANCSCFPLRCPRRWTLFLGVRIPRLSWPTAAFGCQCIVCMEPCV